MLEVIKLKSGKIKPTHILYKSNLSHGMMEEYLLELKEKKFIVEQKAGNHKTYVITPKGLQYLEQYKMISAFTESFGLGS